MIDYTAATEAAVAHVPVVNPVRKLPTGFSGISTMNN